MIRFRILSKFCCPDWSAVSTALPFAALPECRVTPCQVHAQRCAVLATADFRNHLHQQVLCQLAVRGHWPTRCQVQLASVGTGCLAIGTQRIFPANPVTAVLGPAPMPDDQRSHDLMETPVCVLELDGSAKNGRSAPGILCKASSSFFAGQ